MQLIQEEGIWETVVETVVWMGLLRRFFGLERRLCPKIPSEARMSFDFRWRLNWLPSALYMSQHSALFLSFWTLNYPVRKDLSMATSQPKLLQAETLHDRKNHKFFCGKTRVVMFMLAGRSGRSFSHPLPAWTDWHPLRVDFGACPSNSREAESWTS